MILLHGQGRLTFHFVTNQKWRRYWKKNHKEVMPCQNGNADFTNSRQITRNCWNMEVDRKLLFLLFYMLWGNLILVLQRMLAMKNDQQGFNSLSVDAAVKGKLPDFGLKKKKNFLMLIGTSQWVQTHKEQGNMIWNHFVDRWRLYKIPILQRKKKNTKNNPMRYS